MKPEETVLMHKNLTRRWWRPIVGVGGSVLLAALWLGGEIPADRAAMAAASPSFGGAQRLGQVDKNPSTPFLRVSPDGRLYALWTEDDRNPEALAQPAAPKHPPEHAWMYSTAMRELLVASSPDGGVTWTAPRRVNRSPEAIQGEENVPRIAFANNRTAVVWSIPGQKGNKVRANVRFATNDGQGGFTPARTLNDVADTARFPTIETAPDGTFLIGWIDRRVDSPALRQLYLMRLGATGQVLATNYKIGDGLCECCRLGITFADGGKTVYLVDRELKADNTRNHALRKSSDGGMTFAAPIEIADDGWQVPECPHSGPTIGQDRQGQLHITWFTLGRTPDEAGVYYTVSKDGGRTFAPRRLVHGLTGPAILHTSLAVGADGTVWFVWDNLDAATKSQVYLRTLAPDGQTWSPIQPLSEAKENALRPALAVSAKSAAVAWTEMDGEASWVVFRNARLTP
jgi:hypothetical protein